MQMFKYTKDFDLNLIEKIEFHHKSKMKKRKKDSCTCRFQIEKNNTAVFMKFVY